MRTRRRALLAVVPIVAGLLLAACGGGEDDIAKPNDQNVVEISMKDNRFEPDQIEVRAGTTVTFRFDNEGDLLHEAFIGDAAQQSAHEEEMKQQAEASMSHGDMSTTEPHDADEAMLTVQAGESGSLEYRAGDAGEVLIGCHQPGHWNSGMKATIKITA